MDGWMAMANLSFSSTCVGKSFLRASDACSKTKQKLLALIIVLPTVIRGYIQPLRRALCFLTLGLRMLQGQVYSYNRCVQLNVETGSSCLDPRQNPAIKTFIIDGLSMMEGSLPPSVLKPSLHAVSHYPDHATLFDIIWW